MHDLARNGTAGQAQSQGRKGDPGQQKPNQQLGHKPLKQTEVAAKVLPNGIATAAETLEGIWRTMVQT